jgi:hypothetical protein
METALRLHLAEIIEKWTVAVKSRKFGAKSCRVQVAILKCGATKYGGRKSDGMEKW